MESYASQNKCALPESCTYWFCHHHKKCLLHEHVQRNERKEEKKLDPVFNFFAPFVKKPTTKKIIEKKAIEWPEQPLPITIDNFFIRTWGVFNELKALPVGYKNFFESRGSEYFTNEDKTKIVRVSDHWGFNIRFCAWFLKEVGQTKFEKISSWRWKKKKGSDKRIGIITISNFNINNWVTVQPKQKDWKYKTESRWPE